MVKIGNFLSITPWHPIQKIDHKWNFPCLLGEALPVSEFNEYLYDLVLESGHTVEIGGFKVATLGHHFEEDIVKHDYFGTHRVIDDLKNKFFSAYDQGMVTVPLGFLRGEDYNFA